MLHGILNTLIRPDFYSVSIPQAEASPVSTETVSQQQTLAQLTMEVSGKI